MVVAALGAAITQAASASRFVRDVVLEVALLGGSSAGRPGAGSVPDLGQVPEHGPRVMTAGLEPVVACLQGDRVQRDQQVPLAGQAGGQPPGTVPAGRPVLTGRGEREPRRWAAGGSAGRVMITGRIVATGRGGSAGRDRCALPGGAGAAFLSLGTVFIVRRGWVIICNKFGRWSQLEFWSCDWTSGSAFG